MIVRTGALQRAPAMRRRITKGYAKSRQDYDARRRAEPLDELGRQWKLLVQADPCAYCGAPGSDADHIDGLLSGGRNRWDNLTGACGSCNRSKREASILTFMLRRCGDRS